MRKIALYSCASGLLAAMGGAFGYYIILKDSLHFFSDFQVSGLHALISADNYLNFVTNVILVFVLMFQIPIIISFVNRIKPIRPRTMWKGEKWVTIGSLVIAAVVPFTYDLITSLLIALPAIALYNISFLIVLFSRLRHPLPAMVKVEKAAEEKAPKRQRKFSRSQLEEALTPLDWLEEQPIEAPVFNGSLVEKRNGVMELKSKPAKPTVEVPAWYIERQKRREQANIAAFNKIPSGSKLISI